MKSKSPTDPARSEVKGRSREVACPACGKPTLFAASNPSRPFCSPRCRQTDLGGWASESYRIPVPPAEDD